MSGTQTNSGVALDRVVLALQKTFSRVSAETATVEASRARALVTGRVAFSLRLSAEMDGEDRLVATPEGSLALELSGSIETDVRVREDRA